jgi:uncharacterized membrane protein YjgN (DUF898 family)
MPFAGGNSSQTHSSLLQDLAALLPKRSLSFHGVGGSLFGIFIVNILLTILTFGIYRFWAKVRIQRYLLSQTEFESDRFAYHGTGKELLIGFLKGVVIFGVPLVLLNLVQELTHVEVVIQGIAAILSVVLILILIPVATVGSRRYRLSRTSWRGIRFSFRGTIQEFLKLFLKGSVLNILTLGLYYPIDVTRRQAFLVSHSYFGNQRFRFDGRGRDLLVSYMLVLFLSIVLLVLSFLLILPFTLFALIFMLPLIGACWVWFFTEQQRYFWNHTSFATARFCSTLPAGRRLLLALGNLFILLFTLGLGWPWTSIRNIRFLFSHLTLEGPLDFASIQQEVQVASATGEGLADFLNIDVDLG